MNIAAVIPTLNEETNLQRLLDSIDQQRALDDEVECIVVDGGSTDGTVPIAMSRGARVLHNRERLAEPAKRLALAATTADAVLFLDADMSLPGRDYIATLASALRAGASAAFGRFAPCPGDSLVNRYLGEVQLDPLSRWLSPAWPDVAAGDFGLISVDSASLPALDTGLYMREPLLRVLDSSNAEFFTPSGALLKLARLRDVRIAYVPNALAYHHHARSFRDFLVKRWRNAVEITPRLARSPDHWMKHDGRTRFRIALWCAWEATLVGPTAVSVVRALTERSALWLLDPPVAIALLALYSVATARNALIRRVRG